MFALRDAIGIIAYNTLGVSLAEMLPDALRLAIIVESVTIFYDI